MFEVLKGTASKSKIDGWGRSEEATKSATGNRRLDNAKVKRFRAMTDAEFDAFCAGLIDWLKEEDND
ncbi:hypothetical protein [Reinekea sp. G2M2-21]|uniref:hypothetical protein n=1 Tax=Reinekea sp. G2M2-21 TaxID=2788942 RepID=UPI0018AACFDD|nr:hypothetical protein [Reinekea sp. G2M2-21]